MAPSFQTVGRARWGHTECWPSCPGRVLGARHRRYGEPSPHQVCDLDSAALFLTGRGTRPAPSHGRARPGGDGQAPENTLASPPCSFPSTRTSPCPYAPPNPGAGSGGWVRPPTPRAPALTQLPWLARICCMPATPILPATGDTMLRLAQQVQGVCTGVLAGRDELHLLSLVTSKARARLHTMVAASHCPFPSTSRPWAEGRASRGSRTDCSTGLRPLRAHTALLQAWLGGGCGWEALSPDSRRASGMSRPADPTRSCSQHGLGTAAVAVS